nr:MAG TPA: antitoxin [Caudoviricetes sp.]
MSNEVKKTIRIPVEMQEYISRLARALKIPENNVIKIMIFDYMANHKGLD